MKQSIVSIDGRFILKSGTALLFCSCSSRAFLLRSRGAAPSAFCSGVIFIPFVIFIVFYMQNARDTKVEALSRARMTKRSIASRADCLSWMAHAGS
jgi:hypothetical protein